ncbi:hypothetical protein [Phenylobacterium sp.]|uniref:hypothetical protein n=1 Tax=Phenylobacterium sp. TaxID=1871053 RepID=UPI0035B05F69
MRIAHHPSGQVISDYLIANLSPGVSLAVAAHLDMCPVCAMAAAAVEGGQQQRQDRSAMSFRAQQPQAELAAAHKPSSQVCIDGWTQMRKGVEGALAQRVSGLGECVYLLRAAPGADIGVASVRSAFVLLVTAGALRLDGADLGAGDFVELAEPPTSLAAAAAGATLLVVAEDAPLRLRRRGR